MRVTASPSSPAELLAAHPAEHPAEQQSEEQPQHRVVIVDDHLLFAQALELALSSAGHPTSRIELGQTPGSATTLVARVLRERPQLLLLDLDLGPHGDGYAIIEPASRVGIDVLVVSGTEDASDWARAVIAGARKVMSKTRPLSEVVATVGRLVKGLPVMSAEERRQLLDASARQREGQEGLWARFDTLSLRESEVLGQLMQGHAVRDIALHDYTAEGTVRTQVKSILAKLEVSSQLAAVGLAYQVGWRAPFDRPLSC
jgi:two-component system nitrate/nitrite response regulator NarL